MNFESLVGNEEHHHVGLRRGAVLHQHALREPDEGARPMTALVSGQRAFQHVDPVAAGMSVPGCLEAGWVSNQPDLHARVRILKQQLPKVAFACGCHIPFFPGHGGGVDGDHFILWHVFLRWPKS
jgi:hypothetical protein